MKFFVFLSSYFIIFLCSAVSPLPYTVWSFDGSVVSPMYQSLPLRPGVRYFITCSISHFDGGELPFISLVSSTATTIPDLSDSPFLSFDGQPFDIVSYSREFVCPSGGHFYCFLSPTGGFSVTITSDVDHSGGTGGEGGGSGGGSGGEGGEGGGTGGEGGGTGGEGGGTGGEGGGTGGEGGGTGGEGGGTGGEGGGTGGEGGEGGGTGGNTVTGNVTGTVTGTIEDGKIDIKLDQEINIESSFDVTVPDAPSVSNPELPLGEFGSLIRGNSELSVEIPAETQYPEIKFPVPVPGHSNFKVNFFGAMENGIVFQAYETFRKGFKAFCIFAISFVFFRNTFKLFRKNS